MLETSYLAVFLVGLLGGGHCVGMCGGLVSAVTITLPNAKPKLAFLMAYNTGRILSYALAGLLVGALGASSLVLQHILPIQQILYGASNVLLILLGLYLSGIWGGLTYLEKLGVPIWRHIQPFAKRFLPADTWLKSFVIGTLWGWLPCGLVYSVLIAALASASMLKGGLLMLCFGLGTLPTLMTMGLMAVNLKKFLHQVWVRRLSGLLILAFGSVGLIKLILF